jgi:hypothetical protein
MNRQLRALSLIAPRAVLVFQQAATALAQNGPPPKDRYIIVLKPAKNGAPELTDQDSKTATRAPHMLSITSVGVHTLGSDERTLLETKQYETEDRVKAFLDGHLDILIRVANGIPPTAVEKKQVAGILGDKKDPQKGKPKGAKKPKLERKGNWSHDNDD